MSHISGNGLVGFVLIGLLLLVGARTLPAAEAVWQTQTNVAVEITFTAARTYHDPFSEITLDVVFTDPAGVKRTVPAFWDGGNLWKVRYASPLRGKHRFRSVCSAATDAGLHGVTGMVQVARYTGKNPLYRHGPVRVGADRRHFTYGDGTPFFWLGDTWWMGVPYAAAMGDRLRLIYVPAARPILLQHLHPDADYRVTLFDPVTGQRARSATLRGNAAGEATQSPPPNVADWVGVLEQR
jgi:hypothetical protein